MNPLAMRLAIKSTPASGEIPRTITRLVTCLAWDMRYVCHAYCDIYPSSIPKFVCLKSFLHSPRRGAELSYHKPADHWWSWHFINILSLSIGNFLSIHRLNYGQTSSRSTYFWPRQSRFLPLPATQWRALRPLAYQAHLHYLIVCSTCGEFDTGNSVRATSTCNCQGVRFRCDINLCDTTSLLG